jgi:large subunit ribosomal protein L6
MIQKDKISKSFKIVYNKDIFVYSLKSNNLLVFPTGLDKKYINIPNFVELTTGENSLQFTYDQSDEDLFNQFLGTFNNCLRNFARPYRKKLFLKGLGYRVSISDDKKFLLLKLGYSHTSSLTIPMSRLNIKVNKNFIIVEGFDAVEVGNFSSKIRRLRVPDIYKGKGVWYKNEIKILKELKKK